MKSNIVTINMNKLPPSALPFLGVLAATPSHAPPPGCCVSLFLGRSLALALAHTLSRVHAFFLPPESPFLPLPVRRPLPAALLASVPTPSDVAAASAGHFCGGVLHPGR